VGASVTAGAVRELFPTRRSTGMRQGHRWTAWCVGILVGLCVFGVGAESVEDEDKEPPTVFQAAGPTIEAI
jgi:hypothetical protein